MDIGPCKKKIRAPPTDFGGEKPNKHKQLLGIVSGMGEDQICLCVGFFPGEKKRKHINKIPRTSPENRQKSGLF